MKLKSIKTLKADISGIIGSRFKISRSLKEIKSKTYFKVNRNLKRRKIKRNSIFRIKSVLNKAKSVPSFFYSGLNKNSRALDFNSTNKRNVFLRTKRKSSFGQTLLEKQRLKFYIPYINENYIKKYFKSNIGDTYVNPNATSYKDIFKRMDYALGCSSIFISRNFIKSKLISGNSFFTNSLSGIHSYNSNSNLKYSFLKLSYTKTKQEKLRVFERIIPNNVLQDIRINKFKSLGGNGSDLLFPFDFNVKRVIQHYRLKRG